MQLPDGNPKTLSGQSKPGLHAIPAVALIWLGQAMEEGRRKYGLVNWRRDPVTMSVYVNAASRHLLLHNDGETFDPNGLPDMPQIPHLAKAMACCAIVLDALAQGTMHDDRETAGTVAALIESLTQQKVALAHVETGPVSGKDQGSKARSRRTNDRSSKSNGRKNTRS